MHGRATPEALVRAAVRASAGAALNGFCEVDPGVFVRAPARHDQAAAFPDRKAAAPMFRVLASSRGTELAAWLCADRGRDAGEEAQRPGPGDEGCGPRLRARQPDGQAARCGCRTRIQDCLIRLELERAIETQVVLLLAACGETEEHAAARQLRMSVPSFRWLLGRARAAMQEHVCSFCPLGRSPAPAANRLSLVPGFAKPAPPRAVHAGAGQLRRSRLTRDQLLALRTALLNELGFGAR